MSNGLRRHPGKAVELLELRDSLDMLDDKLRIQKIVFLVTPLVSTVLAVPLLIILFLNAVPLFAVYPVAFLAILGAILWALGVERGRLGEDREAIRERIREIEGAPAV